MQLHHLDTPSLRVSYVSPRRLPIPAPVLGPPPVRIPAPPSPKLRLPIPAPRLKIIPVQINESPPVLPPPVPIVPTPTVVPQPVPIVPSPKLKVPLPKIKILPNQVPLPVIPLPVPVEEKKNNLWNQRMADIIENEARSLDNAYRRSALLRGANFVRNYALPIMSVQQIIDLPKDERKDIGSDPKHGTLKRIQEILDSGVLQKDVPISKNVHAELEEILGIGPATSQQLVQQGVTGIDDLRSKVNRHEIALNRIQMIGLQFHDDLRQRIPREEVKSMGEFILKIALQVDSKTQGEIVGSYRRGKASSGDIDILITNPLRNPLVPLIRALEEQKFITHIISGDPSSIADPVKFQGTHMEKGVLHKFDIRYVPVDHWPTSLLHATGSDQFNIMLRQTAIRQNKKLSEHGLFELRGEQEIPIPVKSEEDIFTNLGLPYWSPEMRDLN